MGHFYCIIHSEFSQVGFMLGYVAFLLRDMTTQIAVQSTCIINNHVSSFYCSGAKTIGSGVGVAVGVSVGFGVSVGVRV